MEDKHQEALNYVNKSVCTAMACLGVNDTKTKESLYTLQELVDEYKNLKSILEEYNVNESNIREILLTGNMFKDEKTPTEEEIIKEWEELGYKLTRRERRFISYQNNLGEFIVMSWYSEFTYEKHWNGRSKSINLKEHNLIYKTMKLFEIELGG